MDGNGRWAKRRALPRAMGHKRGVEAVRTLVRSLKDTSIECLTLYAFSSENWKRPQDEVSDLMNLMRSFIRPDLEEFVVNGVRLKIVGDWRALDPDIVAMLEDALRPLAIPVLAALPRHAELVLPERHLGLVQAGEHGDIAAFSIDTEGGEEAPAVLVHCRVSDPEERIKLRDQIADKVRGVTGMSCVVELVPPRTLPRTSSGKLSRAKAKKQYLAGEIVPLDLAA